MKLWQKILWQLLFFTPIGYFLRMLSLLQGDDIPGVFIHIAHDSKDAPTHVHIKENPYPYDRFNWFSSGVILLAQTTFIISSEVTNRFRNEFILAYGWFASMFGVVSIISSIFPTFNWNWKFPIIRISVIELLLLGMLILPFVVGSFILWPSK